MESEWRRVVESIPDDVLVQEIIVADWPCLEWKSCSGVTLAEDAAHAMTMYRGEAANHGFLDALNLCKLESVHTGDANQAEAVGKYEDEMRMRTARAVLLS